MILATTICRNAKPDEIQGSLYSIVDGTVTKLLDHCDAAVTEQTRGGDRGLRGVAVINNKIYVAASKAVLVCSLSGEILDRLEHPSLGFLHELAVDPTGFWAVSTARDAILHYHITNKQWDAVWKLEYTGKLAPYPLDSDLPFTNEWAINSVHYQNGKLHVGGLRVPQVLIIDIATSVVKPGPKVPTGTHNVRIYDDYGLTYCDTESDCFVLGDRKVSVPDTVSKINSEGARSRFMRGFARVGNQLAVGYSPATVHMLDPVSMQWGDCYQLCDDYRYAVQSISYVGDAV